ncbi:MAG TPA: GntR family transcriptional regulator [Ktedonobacterales bacterium]
MPLPKSTTPLTRVCLSDVAYARLRDWILDGTLAPGEPLRDEALAEALGMSRTPIRDALRRLEEEGLALSTATRRTQVSPVTVKQAREVYPMVATLEGLALQLALPVVSADSEALSAMRSANARLAVALRQGDAGEATAADEDLHMAFVTRCGNEELIALLGDLRSKVRRIERIFWGAAETDRSPSVDDHERLISVIAAGNRAAAERELAHNWERGLSWINPITSPATNGETNAPSSAGSK